MIRYLPHAQEALEKRGINQAWVEVTILTPDWSEPDPGHGDRTRSFKVLEFLGGRVLRVVHWADGRDVVVLTAMLDRDALKNRRR
jgi:hypothetical protein